MTYLSEPESARQTIGPERSDLSGAGERGGRADGGAENVGNVINKTTVLIINKPPKLTPKKAPKLDVPPVPESSPYVVLVPLVCTDRSSSRCLFQNSWFPVSSFPYEIKDLSGSRYAVLEPFLYEKMYKDEEDLPSGVIYLPKSRA